MRRAPDLSSIGGRLHAERLRIRCSQSAFAAIAGVTKGAVQKWENGTAFPNAAHLAAFEASAICSDYIITGRTGQATVPWPDLRDAMRALLALLPGDQRMELLLDLWSEARAKS